MMNPHDSTRTSSRRRRCGTRLVAVTVGVGAALALPGAASAHITVQPDSIEGGGFSVVSVRVPNERDDASTTKVRVLLPVEQPLASVQTTPIPGWRVTTAERTLDEPLEYFGSEVTSVVSEVSWTATDGGVQPGQFQDLPLSLGQLPESGELVFKAVQTYSSGEKVNWNEVAVGDSVEPEHPAPVLSVTAPAEGTGASASAVEDTSDDTEAAQSPVETAGAAGGTDDGSSSTLPVALSGAALLVALGALVLAWRRRA